MSDVQDDSVSTTTVDETKSTTQVDPGASTAGQSTQKSTNEREQTILPERFRGKSPEELYQSYSELEKKLGEQSSEVEKAKKTKADMDLVLQAIWSDPELYQKTQAAILKVERGEILPETRTSTLDNTSKGNSESNDEVRAVTQNRIFSDFNDKYRISALPSEQKAETLKKIANEVAEMVDPGGNKSMKEIYNSIRLDKLDSILEKAYKLAYLDDVASGKVDQSNIFAAFGRTPSSSGAAQDQDSALTKEELQMAEKLGVTPEKYAKQKKNINK